MTSYLCFLIVHANILEIKSSVRNHILVWDPESKTIRVWVLHFSKSSSSRVYLFQSEEGTAGEFELEIFQ